MYIISKKDYKDYYDGVAGTVGIDKTIVYERHPIEFNTRETNNIPDAFKYKRTHDWKNPFRLLNHIRTIRGDYDYGYFIVGFCGKSYIGFKQIKKSKQLLNNNKLEYIPESVFITYDLNEFIDVYEKTQKRELGDDVVNYYNEIKNINALEINRQYNTPIWVYEKEHFYVNPKLSDFDFYKVFDAFTAFQEISMFIGGVLGNKEKEIIQVSDKNKIEQHGFDYKWSFRKEKQ